MRDAAHPHRSLHLLCLITPPVIWSVADIYLPISTKHYALE